MKYLKYFEDNTEPQIGDYVVSNFKFSKKIWADYINSNIGQIIDIAPEYESFHGRTVFYTKYPVTDYIYDIHFMDNENKDLVKTDEDNNKYIIMKFTRNVIINFSPDKENAKIFMTTAKFNI